MNDTDKRLEILKIGGQIGGSIGGQIDLSDNQKQILDLISTTN